MKNLKNKVFLVISLILTIFALVILITFNIQSYSREKNIVESSLNRMGDGPENKGPMPKEFSENEIRSIPEIMNPITSENNEIMEKDDIRKRVFMDAKVYTVIIENNNVSEIINNTEEEFDESKIKQLAENIIVNSEDRKERKIGNLYFEDYFYTFKNINTLTIVDNISVKNDLRKQLITSLVVFVLAEIVIIYVSKKVTNWAIRPALQALSAQKQFIADASHELKTPLAVILASSEALEDDYQEKWVDNIKSEAERMNRLVNNLLELARLENATDKEQFSMINLSKLVEKSTLTFEGLMYEKEIKLETNLQENINFNCNSDEIKQVLAILLDNAIKHSEKNGKVTVSLKKEKNIILEVTNKGKEIPKEEQEKIFERFYRGDESRNRDDNRYGLGLAIAKGIITKHNGVISASSKDGFTTFKIIF